MDNVFFPGSDDELGFVEEEIDGGGRLVKIKKCHQVFAALCVPDLQVCIIISYLQCKRKVVINTSIC